MSLSSLGCYVEYLVSVLVLSVGEGVEARQNHCLCLYFCQIQLQTCQLNFRFPIQKIFEPGFLR